ncbi:hypothetical protein N8616_00030 [Verrucomicrobia bacterium]|nr:hypothetical protein [Verrucomicrobiota bacterium]
MPKNRKRRGKSSGWRRKLEQKAGQSALLSIMINKPGFRYTVLSLIFAFLCAGFYMAPLWNIAPDGSELKVKSSLYKIRQVKQLKARAVAAMDQQNWSEAAYQLRVALLKNSIDPTLYRMMLTNSMSMESLDPSDIGDLTKRSEKLLTITSNNLSDLDLVISFMNRQGLHEQLTDTLLACEKLAPNQAKRLLELLFESGRYGSFNQVKEQYAAQLQEAFPELKAYESALIVLNQATFDTSLEGVRSLNSTADGSDELSAISRKLLLQIYSHFELLDGYDAVFRAVKKNQEDQPVQHAAYWELLIAAKQPQKAIFEAAQYWPLLVNRPINRLNEVLQIAHAYQQVGIPKKSFELLDQTQPRFEDEAAYWVGYGDLLLGTENWLEATALAVKLRSQKAGVKLLKPYAYYLEGISQGELNRRPSASNAFSELIKLSPLKDKTNVLKMVNGMLSVGLAAEALEFLQLHDASLQDRVSYSLLLYRSAKAAGNSTILSEADQALFELRSDMPDTDVRRLETAILVLDDTVKALESFLASRSEAAMDDTHRLLVACAYMLQENDQKAAQWLKTIDKNKLGNRESAIYAFVNVEWLVRNGRSEEARKQLALLNRQDLFPTQAFRLEALELQVTTPDPLLFDQ